MKLIVGLGNPGPQYAMTRHNLGFMVADRLAEKYKWTWKLWGKDTKADLCQGEIKGEKVVLLKPLTFMNLSGQSVVSVAHFFKILPDEICAIHDEVDLPLADVRLKVGGGEGGHNGLKSMSASLSSKEYARIRMGIGRPVHADHDMADFVLQAFSPKDLSVVEDMIERGLQAAEAFVAGEQAFKKLMNTMNQRPKEKSEEQ